VEPFGWLWVAFTIGAAASQTARNAMQRSLTERLGTLGATHVRFLYGLPFGVALLAAVAAVAGLESLRLSWSFLGWTLAGAVFQIAGTALMLAAMRERAFVIAIAYVKTEPVLIAAFGFVVLGDALSAVAVCAVLIATAGVLLMSLPARGGPPSAAAAAPAAGAAPVPATPVPVATSTLVRLRPALLGIGSGAMFALSAVGFRGAILELGDAVFYVRSTFTLVTSLALQTAMLSAWLFARDRAVLVEVLRAWRPSLAAGAAGALASQMWFLAFSLQTAAAVRTVGLVEILFAQAASRRLFSQRTSRREMLGIALMVAGLVLLLSA
jgi:drug/metabolite transporter (DMT)-like permease